jgi:hypothetical protein
MNRQSKIVASSRKERILSTYFIDKEKEVYKNESRAKRAQSVDNMKNKNKKNSVTLAPLSLKSSSQSEKFNSKPFSITKVDSQIIKSESNPAFSNGPKDDLKKRSALFFPKKEDEKDDDDEGDRSPNGDDLSCFTFDERSLNDDDESVTSSVDSESDLNTLTNIYDNGYRAECVAQPLTPRSYLRLSCFINALNYRVHYLCLRGWVYRFYIGYIDKIMKPFSI